MFIKKCAQYKYKFAVKNKIVFNFSIYISYNLRSLSSNKITVLNVFQK